MKIVLSGKSSRKLRFFTIFITVLMIIVSIFAFILASFKSVFEEKVSHAARTEAVNIINDATGSIFSDISIPELVIIDKDESGNITSVNADTVGMNKLKTMISKSIQEYAEDARNSTVYIPIGSLTNFAVLQGLGYRIPISISTDSFSKVDFDDEFTDIGINQVKHKIFMTVSVRVSVISAVFTKTETVTTEVPISETVIPGTVPNYYGDNMSILGR